VKQKSNILKNRNIIILK